jgi:hypothetical protein
VLPHQEVEARRGVEILCKDGQWHVQEQCHPSVRQLDFLGTSMMIEHALADEDTVLL